MVAVGHFAFRLKFGIIRGMKNMTILNERLTIAYSAGEEKHGELDRLAQAIVDSMEEVSTDTH